MPEFRMDRTAFRINTYEEADNNTAYWLTRPPAERLRAANYLIRQAWNLAQDDPMRMDRTVFSMRKHAHRDDENDQLTTTENENVDGRHETASPAPSISIK